MKDLVLYCKTYSRDFLRVKRLLASIKRFNIENIPVYISTPEMERSGLERVLGNNFVFHWISDESIVAANPKLALGIDKGRSGGLAQQAIKAEFWRLGIS